jgi:hypothetical protein
MTAATNVAQFYEPVQDHLTAGIAASATSIARSATDDGWPGDGSGPLSADFYLLMEDGTNTEVVKVTAGQGTESLTVTRHVESLGENDAGPYAFDATVTTLTPHPVNVVGLVCSFPGATS